MISFRRAKDLKILKIILMNITIEHKIIQYWMCQKALL